jgi:hypothetical protein
MRSIIQRLCWAGLVFAGPFAFGQPQSSAETALAAAATPPTPPLPPLRPEPSPKSRLDFFRQLLSMGPSERERVLSAKSERQKEYIKTKLKEYESLPRAERELRLRLVQVYSYLSPLMRMAPTNRMPHLALVPDEDRTIIAERLWRWDQLTPASQKEILEQENTMQLFLWFGAGPPPRPQGVIPTFTPEQRNRHEEDLERWNRQSVSRRQEMLGTFKAFLDQPSEEKEKTLKVLSEADRHQMEGTLQAFEHLPRGQRQVCIDSFRKFASLSAPERDQFLKNAILWEAMTPVERETWRKLVTQLPPFPPGLGEPPLPPLPSGVPLLSATNASK